MSRQIDFPREPYEGQRRLAESIYDACEKGETAIFESPTGTGKSLAVLSGSISYLNNNSFNAEHAQNRLVDLRKSYDETSKNKSIPNADKFKRLHSLRCEIDKFEDEIFTQSQIERHLNHSVDQAIKRERQKFLSDEDGENEQITNKDSDDIEQLGKRIKKLIYVSRTHSQLTQFIREMNNPLHRSKRPVQIGSRASLCLNQTVNSLPSSLVNCECARLVKNTSNDIEDIELDEPFQNENESQSSKRTKRDICPFYKREKILQLRSEIWKGVLLNPKTSLKEEGQKIGACPFFAAKAALPLCDVVAMPYNVLFDRISRDSYGINLKENIVIVDEAHNFLSTVYETASFTLNLNDLDLAKKALEFYLENTKSTKPEKLLAVRQMISTLERFHDVLNSRPSNEVQILKPVEIQRDMSTTSDYLKLAYLIESGGLIRESRAILSRYWTSKDNKPQNTNKLSALAALVRQQKEKDGINQLINGKRVGTPIPSKNAKVPKLTSNSQQIQIKNPDEKLQVDGVQLFGSLVKLFRALLQSDSAKFIYQPKERQIRYIRLDIDSDLQKLIKESRSFIMVGGTMRPRGYISSVLKYSCSIDRVVEEQFGHVIPTNNLLPLVISYDSQNNPLSLKVSRLNNTILERYSRTLADILNCIPYGCVIFLPNYNLIMTFEKLLRNLKLKKEIFSEKRGQDVEELIRNYTKFATSNRSGAVLLASASGRLGEGINFSDNLARAVIMVGLPYPNVLDIETKMRAAHAVEEKLCSTINDFLMQSCVRIVAQCMGRAIRHANDFAALIFMDSRYDVSNSTNEVVSNLPEWMTNNIKSVGTDDFSGVFQRFFSPLMSDFEKLSS